MFRDSEYFRQRADEERKAAVNSAHPTARERHVQLAEAYERQVRTFEALERRSALHLVDEAKI